MTSSLRLARRRASVTTRRAALVALTAAPLAVAVTTPAHAADTVTCAGAAQFYTVAPSGTLSLYKLANPSAATAAFAPKADIGRGWDGFGKLVAGPGGRLYGINADGVRRYRYNGSGWDTTDGSQSQIITTGWTAHASAPLRDKITVDETGDFYLVDATGRLRWSRYDEQARQWTFANRVLATGWDRFNLIVAGTTGTLYARQPDGKLFRFRFDPVSQRWLERNRQVGVGWDTFTKGITSAGGDTLFGIKANGDLVQYRFREDNGSWPVAGHRVGTGWHTFLNVSTTTDTCKLTVDHSPARPSLPLTPGAPVAAIQAAPGGGAALGDLYFAYTNNLGRLMTGRQDADNDSTLAWTPEPNGSYTGTPTLGDDGNGSVRVFAQRSNSDLATRVQTAPDAVTFGPWTELGGAMIATPTAVRLSNNTFAAFGVGADGSFWFRSQDGAAGDLLPWTKLAGTGLTGAVTAVATTDRAVLLLATDANGVLQTARYRDGALVSPWTTLGGGGLVGAPSVVTLPGPLFRVFARTTDGRVVTQVSDAAGQYPGAWQQVGDASFVGTGSPAALLHPDTDRIMVLSRAADDTVSFVYETAPGAAQWGAPQDGTGGRPVASDPVPLVYQIGGGSTTVSFVVRMPTGGISKWVLNTDSSARQATTRNRFSERVLPAAPAE